MPLQLYIFILDFSASLQAIAKILSVIKTTDFGQIRTRIIGAWGKHITMALELLLTAVIKGFIYK